MPYTDPVKQKEAHRRWYLANREKKLAMGREWSKNNRAKRVEYVQRHRAKHPERCEDMRLKRTYGITLEQYNEMFAAQDGRCAICGAEPKDCRDGKLVVDHMHCSGKVRSLLCHKCNSGIAMLQDDPSVIYAAAQYVRKHKVH